MSKMVSTGTMLTELGKLTGRKDVSSSDVYFIQRMYRVTSSGFYMDKLSAERLETLESIYIKYCVNSTNEEGE